MEVWGLRLKMKMKWGERGGNGAWRGLKRSLLTCPLLCSQAKAQKFQPVLFFVWSGRSVTWSGRSDLGAVAPTFGEAAPKSRQNAHELKFFWSGLSKIWSDRSKVGASAPSHAASAPHEDKHELNFDVLACEHRWGTWGATSLTLSTHHCLLSLLISSSSSSSI